MLDTHLTFSTGVRVEVYHSTTQNQYYYWDGFLGEYTLIEQTGPYYAYIVLGD